MRSVQRVRHERPDAHQARLDEEVPHARRLVHVDLDEIARLAPAQLAPAPRVLADKRLLDDEVRLREDAQLRAERLLFGCEEVERGAVCKVERGS